jgi:hypothetical protein
MSRELSSQDIVALRKIFRLLKHEQPDTVHTHTAKAGTVGRIVGFFYYWLNQRLFSWLVLQSKWFRNRGRHYDDQPANLSVRRFTGQNRYRLNGEFA